MIIDCHSHTQEPLLLLNLNFYFFYVGFTNQSVAINLICSAYLSGLLWLLSVQLLYVVSLNNNLIKDTLIGLYFCFLAWYNSPIVTVLETLTYPIEELTFPTVTVCPRDSNPDRWGPTIKLFDFLDRRCGSDR